MTENYTRRRKIDFSRKGIRRAYILSRLMWLFWRIIQEEQFLGICCVTVASPLKCVSLRGKPGGGASAYNYAPKKEGFSDGQQMSLVW